MLEVAAAAAAAATVAVPPATTPVARVAAARAADACVTVAGVALGELGYLHTGSRLVLLLVLRRHCMNFDALQELPAAVQLRFAAVDIEAARRTNPSGASAWVGALAANTLRELQFFASNESVETLPLL